MTPHSLTQDQLDSRYRQFETRIRRRNRREYLAGIGAGVFAFGLAVLAAMGGMDHPSDVMIVVGMALVGVGALFGAYQLHRRAGEPPADGPANLDGYRAELARQRDALRAVWLWYTAPLVPGLALVYLGAFLMPGANQLVVGLLALATAAFFAFVVWINLRTADAYEAERTSLEG